MTLGSRSASLVCIGNLTADEAIQPDGSRSLDWAGDALYTALAARAHLDRVTWLAPIGADFPQQLLDDLELAGVAAADSRRRDLPTVRNVVTYRADGMRRWELVHGEEHFDAMSVQKEDVGPTLLDAGGVLVSAMSLRAQSALVPWLRRSTPATLYLDLQEDFLAGHEETWLSVIGCCDVFMPSEVEAVALAGTDDLAAASAMFRELGPQTVVIKRAELGSLVLAAGSDDIVEVPVERVAPTDSTGAGDAFCGAFAAVHVAGGDAVEAARAGSAAARAAIGAPGIRGLLDAAHAGREARVA
jgi:ribokinase